jgi:NADPH:quinone reductase-like Zn-dependent oxidoreductase
VAGIDPPYVVGYEFAGRIDHVGDRVIGFGADQPVLDDISAPLRLEPRARRRG